MHNRGARGRRRSTCCRRCGSATRGPGAAIEPKPRLAGVDAGQPGRRAEHPELGVYYLHAEADADLLFCDNETNARAALGRRRRDAATPRTASTTTSCTARDASTPTARAPRPPPTSGSSCRPAAGVGAGAADPAAPGSSPAPFADADDVIARAAGRGRRVLRRHHAATVERRRDGGHAPGAGRDAVVEAVLLLRPRPVAARAQRPPAARAGPARNPQRVLVPHGQPRRDLDARQVGVPLVRGVGPRVPLHAAGDGRPRLRQEPDRPDALARSTCTRPGRCPPTSGTSATSTRRCTPSPRLFLHEPGGRPGRRSTCRSCRSAFTKLLLNFTWWVNRKDPDRAQRVRGRVPRPRQHRRVRPQRRRCPPAGASSRPTARPGWRCSARTCSSWP